jgi:hypothetical protein
VLAAAGSAAGAAREIFRRAKTQEWSLIATPYVTAEVLKNIHHLPPSATSTWESLRSELLILDDIVTVDKPAVFAPAKDRPILFSAFAWADVLLTLDRNDFETLLGKAFYDLEILKPGDFLIRERAAGRLLR